MNNAMLVLGQVSASGVCCGYAELDLRAGTLGGWRWMLGWGALPAVLLLCGLACLPESPRWLMNTRGDREKALSILTWLRGSQEEAEAELQEIVEQIEAERPERVGSTV